MSEIGSAVSSGFSNRGDPYCRTDPAVLGACMASLVVTDADLSINPVLRAGMHPSDFVQAQREHTERLRALESVLHDHEALAIHVSRAGT